MYTYLLPQTINDRNKIQVGAINLLIELQIKTGYTILDISGATTKQIIIEQPDDTILTKTATFLTDGKDGIIYYKTVSGDLAQAGDYNAQAYLELPDFIGYTTPVHFTVYANLPLSDVDNDLAEGLP